MSRSGERLRRAARAVAEHPPPGPFRRPFWRSPLRGPWLTAVFGFVLLIGVTVVFVTGLLSYAAYDPRLPGNDLTPHKGALGYYLFTWPTHPYWLYRLTQGVHVTLGLVLVPVLLAKLWSVIPKLFDWPPAVSPAQALERLSLVLLVGGAVFEFATGILNVQLEYVFPGSFYTLHFYGAWVFIAAFVVHVALKLRRMVTALRSRSLRTELATPLARTEPEPPDPDRLVSPDPALPTISRRGVLGLVAAGSLTMFGLTVGQSLGGPFRRLALLAPHGQSAGSGPNDFQVNKTAAGVGIRTEMTQAKWRLELRGAAGTVELSREQLLAMPQHHARLPIACVEGWSTTDQAWTGVPLRELARLVGSSRHPSLHVESLEKHGTFRAARLAPNQVLHPDSLLALRVNGADLSLDHGFPARVIVPAAPGVHNTKWVRRLTFEG
ncbi:MAG: molybdopterin-dependent oxidoreductase [Mycobacteriales bacterium]